MSEQIRLRRACIRLALLLVALLALLANRPSTQASDTCQDQCYQDYQSCLYYLGPSYQTYCQQRRDYCLMHCQ